MKQKQIINITLILIIISLITLSGCNNNSTANVVKQKEDIKIGFIAPLTGDLASYGIGEKNAITIAVDEINSKGGINGQKLKIIFEDTKGDSKEGVNAVQKLINFNKVNIIIGAEASGVVLAVAPLVEQNKIILYAPFASHPDISNSGDFVFRGMVSDNDAVKGLIEIIANDKNKKVAIISENTAYAMNTRATLTQSIKDHGLTLVSDEIYESNSKDFRTELSKIKLLKPDALILNSQSGVTGGLNAKQARELGINADFYGIYAYSNPDTLKTGGNALNGLKFTDAPGLNKNNPKAQNFLKKYMDKYSDPASDYMVCSNYDAIYIIANAIQKCRGTDTTCIKNYFYSMPKFKGTLGEYNFDSNGDPQGLDSYSTKEVINAEKGIIADIN